MQSSEGSEERVYGWLEVAAKVAALALEHLLMKCSNQQPPSHTTRVPHLCDS